MIIVALKNITLEIENNFRHKLKESERQLRRSSIKMYLLQKNFVGYSANTVSHQYQYLVPFL